jgi:hypothetical protein
MARTRAAASLHKRLTTETTDLLQRLLAPAKHQTKTHSKDAAERRVRRIAALKRYDQSPRGRFKQQKRNAKLRGIEWNLTYDQWCKLWADSSKWDQRGNWAEGYVMMRPGDTGPYAVGNVVIGRHIDNVTERNRLWFAMQRAATDEKPAEWYDAEGAGEDQAEEDPLDDTPF